MSKRATVEIPVEVYNALRERLASVFCSASTEGKTDSEALIEIYALGARDAIAPSEPRETFPVESFRRAVAAFETRDDGVDAEGAAEEFETRVIGDGYSVRGYRAGSPWHVVDPEGRPICGTGKAGWARSVPPIEGEPNTAPTCSKCVARIARLERTKGGER